MTYAIHLSRVTLLDDATGGFINCFHMRFMYRLIIISDYIKHLFL